MTEVVAVDIGGTHVRFALARVADGRVTAMEEAATLHTAEHASFQLAWETWTGGLGRPAPRAAALSIAGPVDTPVIQLTNNPWIIRPALMDAKLGVDDHLLVNDFGAVAHAVAEVGPEHLEHLCGPDEPLPRDGVVSVVGPGTGLGVGLLLRRGGAAHVVETEGGHIDFAPLDALEDRILQHLRGRYRRVSVERIVSGPGLSNIHEALGAIERTPVQPGDDKALWTAALAGADSLAAAALDRFCLALGSVAGDIALAQGAGAVVIAGGLGLRLREHLPRSGFRQRFTAKGRFETRMAALPVKLLTHPQPGLLGAAAAYAQRRRP